MRYLFCFLLWPFGAMAQKPLTWKNVDADYCPLPPSVHIFFTEDRPDTAAFRAFYLVADLKDKKLEFATDTSSGRRLTPSQFYSRGGEPLVVVNGTFFSFETNQNLNLVIQNGKLVSYNRQELPGRGKDTFTFRHILPSAIGIRKNRKADVAWTYTDSGRRSASAFQKAVPWRRDSLAHTSSDSIRALVKQGFAGSKGNLKNWKVWTAIGGGPVLVQDGKIAISNNEEWKFAGRAISDKHPRTAMGYTADRQLVILVIEGRNPAAGGASLTQEAQILLDLGCVEALNLDGGGSSCLLVNGKETIRPSDKTQRAVPAVFLIRQKSQ